MNCCSLGESAEWHGGELQDLATPSLFGEPRALMVADARSLAKDAIAELAAYERELEAQLARARRGVDLLDATLRTLG